MNVLESCPNVTSEIHNTASMSNSHVGMIMLEPNFALVMRVCPCMNVSCVGVLVTGTGSDVLLPLAKTSHRALSGINRAIQNIIRSFQKFVFNLVPCIF